MVRRSVPASSRWEAKLWRRVCTLTGLLRPAAASRPLTDPLDRPRTDRLVGLASGEEIRPGSLDLPVLAEDGQEPRGEHDVSILVPLGLTNVDDHARAVDVLDL